MLWSPLQVELPTEHCVVLRHPLQVSHQLENGGVAHLPKEHKNSTVKIISLRQQAASLISAFQKNEPLLIVLTERTFFKFRVI
jgi:hypothetical protein